MPTDLKDPFGDYAREPSTAGSPRPQERPVVDEIKDEIKREIEKYGIGKPRRIIVRGTVANDKSQDNTGQ
jgi:hypothetical protein